MTWGEFKKEVDKYLAENGQGDSTPIWYFDFHGCDTFNMELTTDSKIIELAVWG